ncbi:Peptidyl-prolyl cis-trans isomerase PpiD [Minicystis rosea]|nr:Peptidyl-prolyl cis-trans isomerase PpiD [Minicystis rosea]
MSRLLRCLPLIALACASCGSLATSPSWIGGGLAVTAPERMAAQEAKEERERRLIASQPSQIGAKHILVMHNDSQAKPPNLSRTRDEAMKRAQEGLLKIRGGANFDEMVKQYTDEPGGAERAGDLGVFDRGTMVKPFADAAFALKVGEVSEIVETKFGFHIIKRTE